MMQNKIKLKIWSQVVVQVSEKLDIFVGDRVYWKVRRQVYLKNWRQVVSELRKINREKSSSG
jgi:hypothetical protein